ncbi:DUF7344 domain-containing protein [Halomarina oriensis]|uniref:DUF7344 domain-containing protein n=1 Tax=Halomarina oriensis TaxID=671145 RepID=A0A6B0GK24_9EURY|nr:hypothetical protein [Halomarina oriensis]MWG34950.1 hypothetical protein [Halomarina oriensis]
MSSQTPPSVDDVFALLTDPDRRAVLSVLREHGSVEERTLARRAAAHQHDSTPDSVNDERVRATRLTFWHVHLPRLDETSLVDHDRSAGQVEPGPAFGRVVPVLEAAAEYAGQHAEND